MTPQDYKNLEKAMLERLSKGLPDNLLYHSLNHVEDVKEVSERIALAEGCTPNEIILIKTAALFHDAGFMISRTDHEKNSCVIVREVLPSYQFSQEEVEHICELIMATRLPQQPKDKLAEILCDADLDYLGREDFFELSLKLKKEFLDRRVIKAEGEWNPLQMRFFKEHHYFTSYSKKFRDEKKAEHFRMIEEELKRS